MDQEGGNPVMYWKFLIVQKVLGSTAPPWMLVTGTAIEPSAHWLRLREKVKGFCRIFLLFIFLSSE